jgi:hypothetical protein
MSGSQNNELALASVEGLVASFVVVRSLVLLLESYKLLIALGFLAGSVPGGTVWSAVFLTKTVLAVPLMAMGTSLLLGHRTAGTFLRVLAAMLVAADVAAFGLFGASVIFVVVDAGMFGALFLPGGGDEGRPDIDDQQSAAKVGTKLR